MNTNGARRGPNVWVNSITGDEAFSPDKPIGERWMPVYNPRRVGLRAYKPYVGDSDWVREANRNMSTSHGFVGTIKAKDA